MVKRNLIARLIAAPSFVLWVSTVSVCAHAQTTSTSSLRDRVNIDVLPSLQSGTAPGEAPPDPLSYCYYANKSYSMGAKLNGQVCVRPKDEPGVVSSAPSPLKWVSAAQYAHGNY